MATIFSKIVSGEIPCYKVAEDAEHLAFFDVQPIAEGHVLVIPKMEEDYLWDLSDENLSRLIIFAKNVSVKIKNQFPCKKVGMAVIGLEVPHAHIHLVPMNHVGDLDFKKDRLSISPAEYHIWIEKMSE
jgi:histidine triad (HIT) family protein